MGRLSLVVTVELGPHKTFVLKRLCLKYKFTRDDLAVTNLGNYGFNFT